MYFPPNVRYLYRYFYYYIGEFDDSEVGRFSSCCQDAKRK